MRRVSRDRTDRPGPKGSQNTALVLKLIQGKDGAMAKAKACSAMQDGGGRARGQRSKEVKRERLPVRPVSVTVRETRQWSSIYSC